VERKSRMVSWTEACLLTGFLGDAGLQILDDGNWGLTQYFRTHGRVESLFIAAGMMGVFGSFYLLAGFPLAILPLLLYGGVLDLLFRYTMLAGSLEGYYQAMPVWLSFLWGGIPFLLALTLFQSFLQ
jgi:hypothetical protein